MALHPSSWCTCVDYQADLCTFFSVAALLIIPLHTTSQLPALMLVLCTLYHTSTHTHTHILTLHSGLV